MFFLTFHDDGRVWKLALSLMDVLDENGPRTRFQRGVLEWTSQPSKTWLGTSLAGQSSLLAVIGENSYGRLQNTDFGSSIMNASGGPYIPSSHEPEM